MAEALENAYLVLLGQIAFVLSAIVFGVPFFFSTAEGGHLYQPPTILFLVFTFSASFMMVVNIIIGWAALRGSLQNPAHYTRPMFVVDILIVLTFFFMNNAILFSFGGTLSLDKVANLQSMLGEGIQLRTVAFLGASLYLLTALFLLFCKLWNYMFYRASGVTFSATYERNMWFLIAFLVVAATTALLNSDSLITQSILLALWLSGWIYVNWHWLSQDFFGPTKADGAVPVATTTARAAPAPPTPPKKAPDAKPRARKSEKPRQ